MHYVIIGNSAAAIGAVEGIRTKDKINPVTLISVESYHTYSRPLISYFLGKKVSKDKMFYRPKDFYQKNLVKPLLGKKVTKIDADKECLVLDNGESISYDRLLLATGGTPFIPPMKGVTGNNKNIFTFTTWDDAKKIAEVAKKGAKALIIGGGLIGIKACEGLLALGVKVVMVELAERVLVTALDAKGSQIVQKHLKSLGVKVMTGNTVQEIISEDQGGKAVQVATLKDGTKIESDFVIVVIGVRPNMEIVQGTPILTNRGILVDNFMETTVPGIFAAGDVAETEDILYGTKRVIPIWPNAFKQGKIAGGNMVQKDQEYIGSFGMNSIEICGLPTISVGIVDAPTNGSRDYKNLIQLNPLKGSYRRLVIKDKRLIAAILVGDITRAGIFTTLIKDKIDIDSIRNELTKDDFGYISFPVEMRKNKLLTTG